MWSHYLRVIMVCAVMRERVLALGGDFKIESEFERGTLISFSLLLPRE